MNEEPVVQEPMDEDAIEFDPADFPGGEESEVAEEPPQEEAPEEPAGDPEVEPEGEQPTEQPKEETFELPGGQTVSRAELLELAHRGQSAGQLTQELEALRQQMAEAELFRLDNAGHMEDLEELAKMSNTDVAGLLDSLRENLLVNVHKRSRESAKADVQAARALRNGRAQEDRQKWQQAKEAADRQNAAMERAKRDLERFSKLHPGVNHQDKSQVPDEVWQEVFSGKATLTDAYGAYRIKQQEAEIARLKEAEAIKKKNEDNREKAVGSVRSHGQGKTDGFLGGFNSVFD